LHCGLTFTLPAHICTITLTSEKEFDEQEEGEEEDEEGIK